MCQWCTRLNVIACLSESYPLIRLPALIITQYWFIISTQTMVVNSTHVNFHIYIRDRYWNHCRVHENVLGLCTWCLLMLYLGISQLSSTTKCLLMRLRSRTGARAQDIPWKSICPCWRSVKLYHCWCLCVLATLQALAKALVLAFHLVLASPQPYAPLVSGLLVLQSQPSLDLATSRVQT